MSGEGGNSTGGGGGGGLLYGTSVSLPKSVYTVTVGAGGLGGTDSVTEELGGSSILSGSGITTQTAFGGGAGGKAGIIHGSNPVNDGADGGSGGGGGVRVDADGDGGSGTVSYTHLTLPTTPYV